MKQNETNVGCIKMKQPKKVRRDKFQRVEISPSSVDGPIKESK